MHHSHCGFLLKEEEANKEGWYHEAAKAAAVSREVILPTVRAVWSPGMYSLLELIGMENQYSHMYKLQLLPGSFFASPPRAEMCCLLTNCSLISANSTVPQASSFLSNPLWCRGSWRQLWFLDLCLWLHLWLMAFPKSHRFGILRIWWEKIWICWAPVVWSVLCQIFPVWHYIIHIYTLFYPDFAFQLVIL